MTFQCNIKVRDRQGYCIQHGILFNDLESVMKSKQGAQAEEYPRNYECTALEGDGHTVRSRPMWEGYDCKSSNKLPPNKSEMIFNSASPSEVLMT